MMQIVTAAEFAYAIRLDPSDALEHALLAELAEGLVIDELGELSPWPARAKAVVLAAAARAFFNPAGRASERLGAAGHSYTAAGMGVYLTDDEKARLRPADQRGGTFSFPGTWSYPDPVEAPTETISG